MARKSGSERNWAFCDVYLGVRAFLLILTMLPAVASPTIVHDAKILASIEKGVGAYAEDEALPTADDLAKSLEDLPQQMKEEIELPDVGSEDPAEAVFVIAGVYKCGRCDRWHPGGLATAWALTPDGLMVTNYHVIENAKGGAMGVVDRSGKSYPVTEIVAGDRAADLALFRVKAEGLPSLKMGEPAAVGTRVQVISHPSRRFYMHTFGDVARYHLRPKRKDKAAATWMSITADYAKGSSGGPVLNPQGEVVGIVSSTQSIYYESNDGKPKGPLQMVVKNCVPVEELRTMLGSTDEL